MSMSGTQTVERAVRLLRLLSSGNHSRTMGLMDLANDAGVKPPTAHRLLRCLVREGLVVQDEHSRRYALGPLAFELGLAALPRSNLSGKCQHALERLAVFTEDVVFLSVRSGFDSICIHRVVGPYPIKPLTADVGTRRPLGVGASGLALLSSLSDEECSAVLLANQGCLWHYQQLTVEALREAVRQTRVLGYALNERHALPGAISIGMTIRNRAGAVVGAISVGAIASRMPPVRRSEIVAAMQKEIDLLSRALPASDPSAKLRSTPA
jgi:DNA-binding IclR family transcriptional regulator